MRSPHTAIPPCPSFGNGAFQTMPWSAATLHVTGAPLTSSRHVALGPAPCGQFADSFASETWPPSPPLEPATPPESVLPASVAPEPPDPPAIPPAPLAPPDVLVT